MMTENKYKRICIARDKLNSEVKRALEDKVIYHLISMISRLPLTLVE